MAPAREEGPELQRVPAGGGDLEGELVKRLVGLADIPGGDERDLADPGRSVGGHDPMGGFVPEGLGHTEVDHIAQPVGISRTGPARVAT